MGHTKRSNDFEMELTVLARKVKAGTLDSAERERVIMILQNNTTDSSCMVKAAIDEPIFVLRGKDKLAPELVEMWAHDARATGLHEAEKCIDALQCAAEMRIFKAKEPQP